VPGPGARSTTGLGTLVAEAEALRAQLAKERGSSPPGASALTGAELRLLPLLSTHLSVADMAAELFLSRWWPVRVARPASRPGKPMIRGIDIVTIRDGRLSMCTL
jgi:hypothetical protein